jgi:hypothetical protein
MKGMKREREEPIVVDVFASIWCPVENVLECTGEKNWKKIALFLDAPA